MRLSNFPVSPASLGATTVVAAALGLATFFLPSASMPSAAMLPVVYEEVTVTAEADEPSVFVTLRSERRSWLLGEPVTLEATIENLGAEPALVSAASLYDLTVERLGATGSVGLEDVTFLALSESGGNDHVILQPGETAVRRVNVGSDQPFDSPGRYRVSGTWLGGDAPATVVPFDVVIEASEAVAATTATRAPGA